MSDSNKEYAGWCSTTEPYSYLYNFPASSLTSYHYNLCETMVLISNIFSSISLQFMLISVIILILTTFLGKNQEDYNWFIFNTAFLNLFYGIFFEVLKIFPHLNNNILLIIIMFNINLAISSIFLLAFNRFLCLYFPIFYDKVFTQKRLLLWIFFFDSFMICVVLIYEIISHHTWACQTLTFLSLVITLSCSYLIIRKLRKLIHITGEACERGIKSSCRTRDDIRRAAIVCIWQASMSFLHTANVIFSLIFISFLSQDPVLFETFYPAYIITSLLQHPLYQIFVISDTFVTIFLLRSYQSAVIRIYKKVVKKLSKAAQIHPIQAIHDPHDILVQGEATESPPRRKSVP